MRVTIIRPDDTVIIDDIAMHVDCSGLPKGRELILDEGLTSERKETVDFHALQWYGNHGETEWTNELGHGVWNKKIFDLTLYQPYIDAWHAEKARLEALAAAAPAGVTPVDSTGMRSTGVVVK